MKDYALHAEVYGPPSGTSTTVSNGIDINVDNPLYPNLSDQWRAGKVRVTVPALPNNTNTSNNVTITIYDSANDGLSFAQTPTILIQAQVVGVASTGSAATTIDLPLPPSLRGPFAIAVTSYSGCDTSAVLFSADWLME